MSDDVSTVVPPVIVTQAVVSSMESPSGESHLPVPTAEQQLIADRLFTDPHPAATLLSVLTSALLLRDIAVDTFAVSDEDDEDKGADVQE